MTTTALIFPHQLFKKHPALKAKPERVVIIEHPLFFGDATYPAKMHKQKLAFHRASMSAYKAELDKKGFNSELVPYTNSKDPLPALCKRLAKEGCNSIVVVDVHDDILFRRLTTTIQKTKLSLEVLDTPAFINTPELNREWRSARKRWFMADFYQWQRKRLDILMDKDKPRGGKWSFDEDNRRKLPKKKLVNIPTLPAAKASNIIDQAIESIEKDFPDNPGSLEHWVYPVSSHSAEKWLKLFLQQRFHLFGNFEDAIVEDQNYLYHSVLTPMLNTGLLTPDYIIAEALKYAESNNIAINNTEGFVRQIIGWREFMRATYDDLSVPMRTTNHWNHTRKMPASFYDGTTNILPVDNTIKRILDTGYCHHIERLMILGGFMFLCEIDPDHIYKWFMEMFIDSYDWVMVPNVYAMSQNADGGNITTKPYFSGSNYVIKMSHYKKGEWSEIWDALFWRWIFKNSKTLKGNHRWAMMVRNADKMDRIKKSTHLSIAEDYLESLHA